MPKFGKIFLKFIMGKLLKVILKKSIQIFMQFLRLTVSTSNVLNRFKKLNDGKPWKEQIKPFNFFLVGFQAIKKMVSC